MLHALCTDALHDDDDDDDDDADDDDDDDDDDAERVYSYRELFFIDQAAEGRACIELQK